ncbi:MAG: YbhB/YbcL family Raf kinase inhibitor-like protein [Candidatus Omnitrophica bacterium]|nr:YbhB/YbcL family Raf kinase inhibitor-like protein [Candidatus Omnitrophota bacterium]
MKQIFVTLVLLVTTLTAYGMSSEGFVLKSPQLKPGQRMPDAQVYNSFGCTGKNISPALSWEGAPEKTKSFAITMYDPDAPTGSGWWHWIVFNIPAKVTSLPANAGKIDSRSLPKEAIQSRTDFGIPGYGGACPPVGDQPHRYIFTVYSLDVPTLDLDANASGAMIGYYLNAHMLGKTSLIVNHSR